MRAAGVSRKATRHPVASEGRRARSSAKCSDAGRRGQSCTFFECLLAKKVRTDPAPWSHQLVSHRQNEFWPDVIAVITVRFQLMKNNSTLFGPRIFLPLGLMFLAGCGSAPVKPSNSTQPSHPQT